MAKRKVTKTTKPTETFYCSECDHKAKGPALTNTRPRCRTHGDTMERGGERAMRLGAEQIEREAPALASAAPRMPALREQLGALIAYSEAAQLDDWRPLPELPATFRKPTMRRAAPDEPVNVIVAPVDAGVILVIKRPDGSTARLELPQTTLRQLLQFLARTGVALALALALGFASVSHAEESRSSRPVRSKETRATERQAAICARHPSALSCGLEQFCSRAAGHASSLKCYTRPRAVAVLDVD